MRPDMATYWTTLFELMSSSGVSGHSPAAPERTDFIREIVPACFGSRARTRARHPPAGEQPLAVKELRDDAPGDDVGGKKCECEPIARAGGAA